MDLNQFISIAQYASNTGYTSERIRQLIESSRLSFTDIAGRKLINKNATITPSKLKAGRPIKAKQ